jgi:hypothetical protein
MAAEWDVSHPQGLVGEVDCSAALNENWCRNEMDIIGLPTLKYGETSFGGMFLETWSGDRTYHGLSTFVNQTLVAPVCSPGNLPACDATIRNQLESYLSLSWTQLETMIDAKEMDIASAEKRFKIEFDRMQRIYDANAEEHEFSVARIKADLRMLRSVKETAQ